MIWKERISLDQLSVGDEREEREVPRITPGFLPSAFVHSMQRTMADLLWAEVEYQGLDSSSHLKQFF